MRCLPSLELGSTSSSATFGGAVVSLVFHFLVALLRYSSTYMY